ncbi:hypothetical protein [Zobellia uliginosa]|uniref:hypothetical protein n=1 Tax=Zobellia uliginosa TaxID=143224 RepID=UPI001C075BF1|nr:hypothetical protein [Zobellia uliginosa]MBU2947448.1 hypothetical protein [Zobellia uliginosa]
MNGAYARHEKDAMDEFEKKGFTSRYQYKNGELVDLETHKSYKPAHITIVKEIRYEGMSDPEDLSILYIIETNDASKGTFLMAYGPSADIDTATFFKDIPDENYQRE